MSDRKGRRWVHREMAAQVYRELVQTPDMGAFIVADLQVICHHRLDLALMGRSCRGFGDSRGGKRADHFTGWVNDWSRVCAARGPPICTTTPRS
jgi:hypothetical protein